MSFHSSEEKGAKDAASPLDTHQRDASPLGEKAQLDKMSDDVPVEHEESHPKITGISVLLGIVIACAGFLFGYDIGVISGCLIMEDFVVRFGGGQNPVTGNWELPDDTASLITATLSIGTFVGALAQAPVSDYFGRKPSMMIWAGFFLAGAVIQTATINEVGQMYAGRLIAGLGVGALSGLCPLYLAETAPKSIRGAMVSCYQLLIIGGICVAYAITWASNNLNYEAAGWRIPVGFQMLWGVLLLVLMIPLPESPRWLLKNEKPAQCRTVMARMRGAKLTDTTNGSRGDAQLEHDLVDMQEGIEAENQAFKGYNYVTGYVLCFAKQGQMWRRTLTAIMLQILQQLNGQNYYYYYGPTFFSKANIQLQPLQIQFLFGAISLVCTVPALYLVEKMGRRKSLIFGAIFEAICAYIVAFVGKNALAPDGVTPNASEKAAGNAFVAFAVLHLAAYSMFWGPVPWVSCSELFPTHLRAKSISLASAANWLFNFLLSFFSPKVATHYGPYIMLVFAGCLTFAAIFVFFVLPELKGLSLEAVDELFTEHPRMPPWKSSSWQPTRGEKGRETLVGLSFLPFGNKKSKREA
ncbi:putative monosaccharide transporter [Ceraceosorus guamensis]|uniref:Putative monosaccharide transporter n=1 Tax=Ceraceosorus guamensis TaxID=1522189 RepID=A0A316VPB0_9BASI|nr:putative monosaccharide transporter [Ceraceosorus guamensis]PWN39407.1 putative monosaccharide transporter [Ceraceosorus guamensis]